MRENLLRPDPTLLPPDPASARVDAGEDPADVARAFPTSSLACALLAENALAAGEDIDYVGASSVELVEPGESAGSYRETTIKDGKLEVVAYH